MPKSAARPVADTLDLALDQPRVVIARGEQSNGQSRLKRKAVEWPGRAMVEHLADLAGNGDHPARPFGHRANL
jgi:hypothetical protein